MPKVVVNLLKIDENVSFLESVVKQYAEAMDSAGYNLSTHSLNNEIKYLKQFKDDLNLAITKKQAELLKQRLSENEEEACASVKENDGKLFITDKFGNTFYPPPFEYSYVELSYGNFKKFDKLRFLGEIGLVIIARFQMEDVEHNISPTTLKLLENIEKIRTEQNRNNRNPLEVFQQIDELCERSKSKTKPPILDWRYFFKTYFGPPVEYKEKAEGDFPKFQDKSKFEEKDLNAYLKEVSENKKKIQQLLKTKKLKTTAQPKEENPSQGSKQDSDKEKAEIIKCQDQRENVLQGLEDALNDLNEDLERQIENWRRRFDPNCILKELKDCVIPPDLDFCDFIFKDISIPKFYQKIRLLKTAGLGDLYDQIDRKLEEVFGVTELKRIDKEIKSLEKLLEEEDGIRDRLNQALEEYRKNVLSSTEDLRPLTERFQIVDNNLDVAQQSGNQTLVDKLEKQKTNLSRRIEKIQQRLKLLKQQNESIPDNLKRLNVNYDEHLRRKGELERDYKQKIEQNNFNERQAKIIAEGRNLEAIFLVPNEGEQRSPESITTSIINAVDTVMPLENLCKMLFQVTFTRDIKLPPQIPEDLLSSFMTRIKDPYFGISVDFGKLLGQLLLVLVFNILDAMLKALCDAIGNVVANTIEGEDAFESLLQNAGTVALDSVIDESIEVASGVINKVAEGTSDVLQKDMVSWFIETGQPSAFSEWDLSPDGKSFVIRNSPVFDFTQIQQFIQTGISNLTQDAQRYSTQALMDMMSGSKGEVFEESPPEQKETLTVNEARTEMRCLFLKTTSLLTPTETINLFTKKPDQNTIKIVNKLAEICAPKMALNYPGDSLINLLGEMGILAGALEIETKLQDIQDLNNNLPITEKVLCERYDNTIAFRQGLMSNAIDHELAGEILDEIENKKQEEFGYILDSINELAEGNILERPQTAKQFYSDMISQIVEMQKAGKEPESLGDLDVKESGDNNINIKQVLQQKIDKETETNAALNSMFELTVESLIRPYRDRFRRDSENYIDAISLDMPYEKEIKRTQIIENLSDGPVEVLNVELLNILNMDYVPVIKIPNGSITIRPMNKERRLYESKAGKEEVLAKYKKVKDENNARVDTVVNITLGFLKFFAVGIFGLGVIDDTIVGLIDAAIALFGEDANLAEDYENLNEDLKQWIEETFYPTLRNSLDNEYEYVTTQLEQDLEPQEARAIKRDDDGRENREVIQKYKDKTKTFNEIFRSDQNLKDLLKHISYIKLFTETDIFSTNGVTGENLEFKLVPSYVLPISKKIGDKTVLMSKEPDFNFLRDTSQPYKIQNIESIFPSTLDFYVSNGFVEEKYEQQFLDPRDYNKRENIIIENKNEVGKKYKDALKIFSNDLSIEAEDNRFSISISSRHSGSIINPLLDRIDNLDSLDYDSVVSNRITQESLDCIVQQVGNPLDLPREILQSVTRQLPPERQLVEAIPLWKLEYLETLDENDLNLSSDFSLKTTGLSFSPVGKYDDFYHDTTLEGSLESIPSEIRTSLLQKFNGAIPGRFIAFKRFLGTDSEWLSTQLPPDSPFAIQQQYGLSRASREKIYEQITNTLKSMIPKMFEDSRLLENVEDSEQKLIELFDFTREQTDYEKENSLDPNVMDFVELKQSFSELYNRSEEDDLTDEQVRGEKGSENKATKAAKNVLLVSFIRACITEYILKNLVIYDSLSFSQQLSQLSLVIKDIANFVAQEAKRVEIGREIQKQSIIYYDLMVDNQKIEKRENIENQLNEWKASNSFASVVANPKMINIVEMEMKKSLSKFSSILNCGDANPQTDYLIDKIVSSFEEEAKFRKNLISQLPSTPGPELYLLTGTIIYTKKYAKMPKLTGKGNLTSADRQLLSQNQEKEIDLNTLESILNQISVSTEQFFVCDSANSIFESPVKFGAKFLMETVGAQLNAEYNIAVEEIGVDISNIQEEGDIEQDYNLLYDEVLYPKLTNNKDSQIFFKYCLGFNEIVQMLMSHSFLYHNDQNARFLYEGTKIMISKMYKANTESGNIADTAASINSMLEEQRRNEDNTGNPLGPALEALKFYYRTPIQILKALATIVDPNIALADGIVKGAAMAGNLVGQKIDIPYSAASLSLLPFPLFNGVSPPIPPLSSYNIALPLGPIFLGLEPLLWDLPYYKNRDQGKLPTGDGKQNPYNNPLFCELSDEENDE